MKKQTSYTRAHVVDRFHKYGGPAATQQKSTYWDTCPHCGAALDPGESCDCRESCKRSASRVG